MAEGSVEPTEAERQVERIVDQLESVHWQLVGVALSLPESATDKPLEAEKSAQIRRIIECVLTDRIRFALSDLRSVLLETKAEDQDP